MSKIMMQIRSCGIYLVSFIGIVSYFYTTDVISRPSLNVEYTCYIPGLYILPKTQHLWYNMNIC